MGYNLCLSMIFRIGTDIVRIERLERLLEKASFVDKCFTKEEQDALAKLGSMRRLECAAGRFACKEAVMKAVGTGFSGLSLCDVEVFSEETGKPVCRLSKHALERIAAELGFPSIPTVDVQVSISHDGGLAVAMVLLVIEDVRTLDRA